MIVICDKAQDIVIPAGLGDNAGVVYEKSGVESLNGQQGDLTLKTVNGNELLGEGDVAIDTGVESLNGQKGALTLKTVNGNELTGEGNIEIQAGVESVNGQTGAVKIKSVNGQSLVGDGDVQIATGLKYKQITNESRQEVYDDVKAHWDNASGYTGDYVYFYQNGVDQIIFDEVKFENNTAYFNSASVGYTSGQVHNPLVRLLCCIVPSEGNIQINENGRVLSDVNGMRYEANDAIVDSNSITFQENGYGDGYDVYNTTDTGTKDGLFDVRFKNGLNGFKGNAPASIFTDGTDVFMAFDVVDNHYVYKRDGNAWAFVSKTKIGGESGLKYFDLTADKAKEAYDEVANHWDDKSGYTGDYVFRYKKNDRAVYTFDEMGYIRDHSIYFSWLDNADAYSMDGKVKCFSIIIWYNNGQPEFLQDEHDFTIPTKTSQLTNDSDFQTKAQVDTAIENAISGGSGNQNVIVLDGLTQAEVKAIYDKLDKTKVPDAVFVYLNSYSFRTYWDDAGNLIFDIFRSSYDAIELNKITVTKTGEIYREREVCSYTNSCVILVDNHVNETDPFECGYIGNFINYIETIPNKPYAYFIWFKQGYGASTKSVYVPFSLIWDKNPDAEPGQGSINIQFIANEKLYTYLHGDTDNKWLFESAKPITGGGSGESSKTYYFFNDPTRDPNTPNAHNVEVFRAFDKAVQEGGAFNNFYIVNGNETSGQTPYNPILQVTKMEAVDNGVWGGNKGYYVFAGQKSNVETEKLQVHKYCLTDIGGVIDFMVNAVDGGTWTSGVHSKIDDVLTAGADIPCTFEYLEGCDETYFWADNMGGKQGLYNITFNGGYDGYKGNVVADVYGNDTGVYMAFTVNNVRYTYKKNDANSKWELAKSVAIGGVQSSEVSNIKVLTQSEYDALTPKDANTMYCIKSQ